MAAGRRLAVAVPLGLLAVVILLTVLPGDPGSIRLGGVGALWWLALVAAPLAALLAVATPAQPSPPRGLGLAAVAAWAGPAVLVAVAARVFAGAPEAPAVAFAALAVPLAASRMAPPAANLRPNRVAWIAGLVAAGLVLWAGLSTLADVAEILGGRRWQAAVLAAALTLLASEWRPRTGAAGEAATVRLLIAGAAGFVLPLAVLGAVTGAAPWSAWSRAAARPGFTLAPRSVWVTDGRALTRPGVFEFTEAHRVTALAPGAYRIVEQAGEARITREWQLAAGDALTLRPGDRLVLEAGARVRFEAGKRVPGAPLSGALWADPPGRQSPWTAARTLAIALTLWGGALVLARPSGPALGGNPRAAPALLLALVLAAVAWGVYAVLAAPELALGARALAGLFELPAVLVAGPAGRALTVLAVLGLLCLFLAGACALRGLAAALAAGRAGGRASSVWAALVLGAAVASVWPADAWSVFLDGCGLAASAVGAPRLAAAGRGEAIAGSAVGAGAFLLLRAGAAWLPGWAAAVGAYPALLAAPLAFLAGRVWQVAAAPRD
jgi:hypothetical protein